MKSWTALLSVIATLALPCPGQQLTLPEFKHLIHTCVPEADPLDLVALARTESSFYPWALSLNRPTAVAQKLGYLSGRVYLHHQPRTKKEAIEWANELIASGTTVSVGLLQVNGERSKYSVEDLLDPCTNVKQGWGVFLAAYRREVLEFGGGQRALLAAFGAYNAGSPAVGFRNGYVLSIIRNSCWYR